MKRYQVTLQSLSAYSQSKPYELEKENKESADAYEKRTWKHRAHVDENGYLVIPPISIKNCLAVTAQYLGIQIKGKGKATYTKHFRAGILITDTIRTPIKIENVDSERVLCSANGQPGGTVKVWKHFPIVHQWNGTLEVIVLDDIITGDILKEHLEQAGQFVGLGRWRPINGGLYGRFAVVAFKEV